MVEMQSGDYIELHQSGSVLPPTSTKAPVLSSATENTPSTATAQATTTSAEGVADGSHGTVATQDNVSSPATIVLSSATENTSVLSSTTENTMAVGLVEKNAISSRVTTSPTQVCTVCKRVGFAAA